jgi:hypothetical protein
MFTSIPSLDSVLQCLLPVFTQPSFQTHIEVLLGWVMCLSKRTEYGVFQTIQADTPVSRKERHPFDRFYNFFSRSAWTVCDLAHQVAVAVVVQLNPHGLLYLVVDDTLLHKRGLHVYGLGWFRDAVASTAKATAYGMTRKLRVVSFQAVWPVVFGLTPILVVLVRDPRGKFKDKYLFTTDLSADAAWVIEAFSRRWSIKVVFKASKQVMKIQSPQHWCQQSIEKLSPWVWLMQSVIGLWYITKGRKLPAAQAARRRFGEWDTEWSLAHMLRILRTAILEAAINPESATKADLYQLLDDLENYLNLAA